MPNECTHEIVLSGQVQGVGFRPYVYYLAREFDLKGTVCNDAIGVLIRFNASGEKARRFLDALLEKAPAVSQVTSSSLVQIPFTDYSDFRIVPSHGSAQIDIPLTPDFAICQSCKAELRAPNNRRFGYPFTTCTNCGPRYAITTKFPFEREHTTVHEFEMCAHCQSEYEDPRDRRFHSQTNTCAECGIQLRMTDSEGLDLKIEQSEIIAKAAQVILDGSIVAIKNTNGYLLCCDANNAETIAKLRQRKKRPTKPFALLYPSLDAIKSWFLLSEHEESALLSPIAPIVVLNPKGVLPLSKERIAPGLNRLGIMLPSSGLLTLLMDELQIPIVATSGNIHGSPIISAEAEATELLSGVADHFVHHNLEISFPQDDSVIQFAGSQRIVLRRSRGMAPNYLSQVHITEEHILGMGAHLKGTFTFLPNRHTYVSPYFGNLDNYGVGLRYRKSLNQFQELFSAAPETILIDRHPNYESGILGRELAEKLNAEQYEIQHHEAHFASVLGEHQLFESKEKILGVIWDGTGLGDDGAIWGGEFFAYSNGIIERVNHFEYFDCIAGNKMAQEPRLSLLSALPESHKEIAKSKFSESEWRVYQKILPKNTLQTSSVGRIFDAVASLLDIIDVTTYEGEAAMLLQAVAEEYHGNDRIDFLEGQSYDTIPTRTLLTSILKALEEGVSKPRIASSFLQTLVFVITRYAKQNNFSCIACSGGVFQNSELVSALIHLTSEANIELKLNRFLSCNDENISFGQVCHYQYINH